MFMSTKQQQQRRHRPHKTRSLRGSLACVSSNIIIVCVVIGYIIGGGFLFMSLEADAEYERLKNGSDRVNKYKQRFLSENKRQIQTYKSKLMEQTKQYFTHLHGAVDSLNYRGQSPQGQPRVSDHNLQMETKQVEQIIKMVKNMSFLHIETISEPALRTFNRTNSKVTDNFIEEIYNTTVNGFIIDFVENNTTLWTLPGAILYSVTVITTIGYGNIVPKTNGGKVATIIYAMFGIPLMLLCLANLGALLADLFRMSHNCFITQCHKQRSQTKQKGRTFVPNHKNGKSTKHNEPFKIPKEKKTENHSKNILKNTDSKHKKDINFNSSINSINELEEVEGERNDLPLTFALIVFVIYILIGSLVIKYWENWYYLDSVYFVFITFSTIGFGDLVPGAFNYQWSNQITPISCALYLLLGLVLLSMCFQLIQDTLRKRARGMAEKMGLINSSVRVK